MNQPQPINRFQVLSRLSQYYTVECVARALDYRLEWHRGAGRSTIFGCKNTIALASVAVQDGEDSYHPEAVVAEDEMPDLVDDDDDDDVDERPVDREREIADDSSPSFLNDSFTGSPRHLKSMAKNSLMIVSEMGQPTVFITLTCNIKDPAITSRLLPGQTAFDRPEIVVHVWHAQLQAFLHNLRNGKYLSGKPTYMMYVIEYQHRGLPHAHIVCQLEGAATDAAGQKEWVDKHIQARFPPSGTDEPYSSEILKHETHKCADAVNGCLDKNGIIILIQCI